MKALLAGVDLVRPMLDLASGAHSQAAAAGRSGVRSRQLLLTVLGAVREQGTRRAVIRAFAEAVRGHGVYAGAIEELDAAQGRSARRAAGHDRDGLDLAMPSLWRPFYAFAAGPYALMPEAWAAIVKARETA